MWTLVTRVLSGVVLAVGLSLIVPLGLSLLYADGSWESFLLPAAAMVLVGAGGLRVTSSLGRQMGYVSSRDVYLSVTLAWILSALLGGIPFLIAGTFDSPLDSTFEAMSDFTTTGATLLSNIEAQTPSILFWRSMTQWLGGVGIVVLFVAVALVVVGMPLYDAVVHTFTTVATGGFSPKTDSIGFYDSLAVEVIIVFFMTVSGVSFSLYHLFYTRRRFDTVLDEEFLAYLTLLVGATLVVWMMLVAQGTYGASWGEALRDSAFSVSSIITTTGFVTADFDRWDTSAKFILVLLMFVGGCAGSTAGGIKVIRILIVSRSIFQDIFRMVHPRAVT